MRSRVEPFSHLAALAHNLVAPKELADAMLSRARATTAACSTTPVPA